MVSGLLFYVVSFFVSFQLNDAAFDLSNGPIIDEVSNLFILQFSYSLLIELL